MVPEAHGVGLAHEPLLPRTRLEHLLQDHHVELGDLPEQQRHPQVFVVAGLEPLAAVDALGAAENLSEECINQYPSDRALETSSSAAHTYVHAEHGETLLHLRHGPLVDEINGNGERFARWSSARVEIRASREIPATADELKTGAVSAAPGSAVTRADLRLRIG
ncbi:hypothetical protein ON010_g17719 [Phytophthora cinnamomi]|nr:hypothetical protein ON010_g17719 [Phytophthora cinnamomi]